MDQVKRKKRRRLLWIFIPLGLILGCGFYLQSQFRNIVQRYIADVVITGSDSLYRFTVDDLRFNIWAGRAEVINLHISVDTLQYYRKKDSGTLPALTFELHMARAKMYGISVFKLFSNELQASAIRSDGAVISLFNHLQDTIGNQPRPLWEQIRPGINGIYIDNVELHNLRVDYYHEDGKRLAVGFSRCNAGLEDLRIDSASANDTTRMLFARNLVFEMDELRVNDSLYHVEIGHFVYSSGEKLAVVNNLLVQPTPDPVMFVHMAGHPKPMYNLSFSEVELVRFDFPLWFSNNEIQAKELLIKKSEIKIYKDCTLPPDTSTRNPPYPHEMLRDAPFLVDIGEVKYENIRIEYTEKNRFTKKTGTVYFSDLRGTMRNVTNHERAITGDHTSEISATTRFMGTALIRVKGVIPLNDMDGSFSVNADIEKVNAGFVDPITTAFAEVGVKEGTIDRVHFEMHGNNKQATGDLEFEYHDLRLDVIPDDQRNMRNGLATFYVKSFTVWPSNPVRSKTQRTVENYSLRREPGQTFFLFAWRMFLGSMKKILMRESGEKSIELLEDPGSVIKDREKKRKLFRLPK
jgi:hypothetical protein